mmetsp:Transcript_1374/g.4056  ORF Transcript_1374/g.4056 Transcript_1374/m.4056 type:complete len:306 (-) Transcript_1374:440-1357(-)
MRSESHSLKPKPSLLAHQKGGSDTMMVWSMKGEGGCWKRLELATLSTSTQRRRRERWNISTPMMPKMRKKTSMTTSTLANSGSASYSESRMARISSKKRTERSARMPRSVRKAAMPRGSTEPGMSAVMESRTTAKSSLFHESTRRYVCGPCTKPSAMMRSATSTMKKMVMNRSTTDSGSDHSTTRSSPTAGAPCAMFTTRLAAMATNTNKLNTSFDTSACTAPRKRLSRSRQPSALPCIGCTMVSSSRPVRRKRKDCSRDCRCSSVRPILRCKMVPSPGPCAGVGLPSLALPLRRSSGSGVGVSF